MCFRRDLNVIHIAYDQYQDSLAADAPFNDRDFVKFEITGLQDDEARRGTTLQNRHPHINDELLASHCLRLVRGEFLETRINEVAGVIPTDQEIKDMGQADPIPCMIGNVMPVYETDNTTIINLRVLSLRALIAVRLQFLYNRGCFKPGVLGPDKVIRIFLFIWGDGYPAIKLAMLIGAIRIEFDDKLFRPECETQVTEPIVVLSGTDVRETYGTGFPSKTIIALEIEHLSFSDPIKIFKEDGLDVAGTAECMESGNLGDAHTFQGNNEAKQAGHGTCPDGECKVQDYWEYGKLLDTPAKTFASIAQLFADGLQGTAEYIKEKSSFGGPPRCLGIAKESEGDRRTEFAYNAVDFTLHAIKSCMKDELYNSANNFTAKEKAEVYELQRKHCGKKGGYMENMYGYDYVDLGCKWDLVVLPVIKEYRSEFYYRAHCIRSMVKILLMADIEEYGERKLLLVK